MNESSYGQNKQIKKRQLLDQVEYPDNMRNHSQDMSLLMSQQQQCGQQFMTPYSNFSNCSDCYSDYMLGNECNSNNCCIRKQPFDHEYIDSYMQKNKNKVCLY